MDSTPVRAARMNEAGQSISSQIHHNHPRRTHELEHLQPSEIRGRLFTAKVRTGVRFVAVFHDAAGLELSLLSERKKKEFQNYMKSLTTFDLVICISHQSQANLCELWKRSDVTAPAKTFVVNWPMEFDETERSSAPGGRSLVLCVSTLMSVRTTNDSFVLPKNYGTAALNSNSNSLVRARNGE